MLKSVEATVTEDGQVVLKEQVHLSKACRAIVTFLEEDDALETALLSQPALADWDRQDEDEAWAHLRPAR